MVRNIGHIAYHILVILFSAAFALSLPSLLSAFAGKVLAFWALLENEKVFLAALEIFTAVLMILAINSIGRGWKDRKLSQTAKNAGLVLVANVRGVMARRRIKGMKSKQGFAREIMLIGSTGFRTFVESGGDLHQAVQNCREAKIMLLDPFREGAVARAMSIPDPEITPSVLREQIGKSIEYLKGLRAAQKSIRLKLYPDMPLLKLAILGDCAFLRHYHTGLNIRSMPEYVFENDKNNGGLYIPLYRYFLSRWNDPAMPEYDLTSDELVYQDSGGNEVKREKFGLHPAILIR
jgi:hypothetical protein